jgi:hypothetical protein
VAFPELKQLWLADADLFGGFDWAARGRRERSGISSFISDLSDLKVGDYVVHIDHGIGIYQGLRQLSVAEAARDFMLLTFQDEAKLYVPLERLDLVEKYRSHEGAKPPLDRLGGASWERTKTRVKRALRDMAESPPPPTHPGSASSKTRLNLRRRLTSSPPLRTLSATWKAPSPWTGCSAATWGMARPSWPCAPHSS